MHSSQYVTNQLMHGSKYVTNTPTWGRCWLQSSSIHPTMKIKKLLGYKTLGAKMKQLLQGIQWTRANSISGHNLHAQSICIELHHFASPLKALNINPYICLGLWEKKPYTNIHGYAWNQIWKSEFCNSRQIQLLSSCCRASALNLDGYGFVELSIEL